MNQLFDPETEAMENWCVSADNQPDATTPNLRVWFDKTTGKLKKAEILPEPEVMAVSVIVFPASEITLQPGEHYAGIIVSKDGEPDYHLILMPGEAGDVTWQAAMDWAASSGGDLPTRREQSLLFANLQDQFQPGWYWSGEQHAADSHSAWFQTFGYGNQDHDVKSYEGRARAVRRSVIH